MIAMNPIRHKGPWNLGGMRCFMMFWMPIFRGRTQRKARLSAFGNSKVKKNRRH